MLLVANREPVLTKLVLLFGFAFARCGATEPPLPTEVSFLPGLMKLHLRYEVWNKMRFPLYGGKLRSGKHWGIEGSIGGAADSGAAWSTLKAAFLANGWTAEYETDDPKAFTLTASSCAGQTTCTATVRADHPGFANVGVSFYPANTAQIMQAESAPVLRQVLALLKKDRSLQVEVQGHTDDVGTDAYNQMLSDSQAAAVVAWLRQEGIAATRLTSKGYGKEKPVADNSSDQGRATNHRIEIADRRCMPKE